MKQAFILVAYLSTAVLPSVAGDIRSQQPSEAGRTPQQIQAILDSISASRIRNYLDTLQNFQFRHTLDDTLSQATGMGAARRWIFRKFQEFSAASGGRLQPQYFSFNAMICGVNTLHRNVMAILPGTVTPQRYFVVSGHMDTRGDPNDACARNIFSPGAVDDGSGTAISIELARVMSNYQFESSIIFMAVTGEDQGLFGSEAYAAFAQSTGQRIDGMITNDVVGNIVGQNGIVDSLSTRHFSSLSDITPHRQMARYMKLTSESLYPVFTVNLIPAVDRPGRGGDHQSFQNHGYTAVRFVEPNENFNNQHTPTDLVANMSPAYTARVARVNAAGLATLLWAPEKPATPTVLDPGTGTSLIVQWASTNTEPDFAGYRIAVRDSGDLFWDQVINVGNATIDTITGLTPGVPVAISISAYDTGGHGSLFSQEAIARPFANPPAPMNIRSTSFASSVRITWVRNPQTINVYLHRIYRSTSRYGGFALHDSVPVPVSEYSDMTTQPHTLYFYQVRAVDLDGSESSSSTVVTGQRVTHDGGVLIVDGTKDGTGGALSPPDSLVDNYYLGLLNGVQVAGEWDVADSVLSGIRISDAEMGRYRAIVWHTDVRLSEPLFADSTELREFLQQGGSLFLGGWRLSTSLKPLAAGSGLTAYAAGTFPHSFLKLDSTSTTGPLSQDFTSALPQAPGYSEIRVDTAKVPAYNGALLNTDVVLPPFSGSGVTTLYTHHGRTGTTLFEGKPVGWKYIGSDASVIVFDIPLYYMKQEPARNAIRQALSELGLVISVEPPHPSSPTSYALHQNYPNPFNPLTTIEYDVPVRSRVIITIHNVLGQTVKNLLDEESAAGSLSITWDGRNERGSSVGSGTYFCRMRATAGHGEGVTITRKLLLLR